MANEYITRAEFTEWLGPDRTEDHPVIDDLLTTASRWVDTKCGRRFYADSVASARVFRPLSWECCPIDDAWAITSVAVDTADDGSYSTTWATTDYQTLPLNGVGANGAAWPATMLQAIESREFPTDHRRACVKVTAKWGWTAVPADVRQATLYYAHRLWYLRDVPGGTTTSVEFGAQPIRAIRDISEMLTPYMAITAGDGRFLVG